MSSMKPSEWAMLVLLSVFWGGSFFFTEIALRGFQPFAILTNSEHLLCLTYNSQIMPYGPALITVVSPSCLVWPALP
jgi:hypothetical protein